MIRNFPKATAYQLLRRTVFVMAGIYCAVTTVMLIRLNPKPLVIGIDPYGTRIIGTEKDPILKAEKENFLKRFVSYLYNFDETNFDDRISLVGDSMNSKLWDQRKTEFQSVSARLKQEPLSQKGRIVDLREIDENHYEADVDVNIQSRLRKNAVRMRVAIYVASAPRTSVKPYPWEVVSYDEKTAN